MILKWVEEEGVWFTEMLEEQKKSIEETEEAMLEILWDMINWIKIEIETERKDREENEETLLSLLEDTCTKLNSASVQ